jgi:processive 1,2-diacylglycerol beta-glucosyltransferase
MKPSILILYSGIGHGHKSLAENITHQLSQDHDVDLVNLFEIEKGNALATNGTSFFLWMMERAPALWNFFYTNKVFVSATLPFRRPVASFNSKKVLAILNAKHYDAVISCHAMTSAIVSYLKLKNKFNGKLIVAFSDYHLHRYWMFDNVDLYLANIPEQKKEMVALGTPAEKIAVVGMTLKQMFQADVFNVKRELGISQDKKVVLVAGGTSGYGIDLRAIQDLQKDAVVIVVCGNNKKLHDQLVLHANESLKVFGYVNNFPELYAIADILVSKPGGLTIAECLQRNLAVAVTSFMPGQERLNYHYLRDHKLIMTDYAQVKNEILMKSFSETLPNNPARNLIVQDSGNLVREAIHKTLTVH